MNKPNEEEKNENTEEQKAQETQEAPAAQEVQEAPAAEAPATKEAPATTTATAEAAKPVKGKKGGKSFTKEELLKNFESPDGKGQEELAMVEKVISIRRVTKVTKGGKKLSFTALVVVGDANGKVGYSLSKAAEVSVAIKKAMTVAKRNMVAVNLRGTTIPHEVIGECSGSRVLLKPASEGTGVIASGPVRAVCDGAGIHNILTKCHRSNNPINVVKATLEGLSRLKSVE